MGKTFTVIGSAVVGAALAIVAGWAVFSSQTSAPADNPASQQVVTYGNR